MTEKQKEKEEAKKKESQIEDVKEVTFN